VLVLADFAPFDFDIQAGGRDTSAFTEDAMRGNSTNSSVSRALTRRATLIGGCFALVVTPTHAQTRNPDREAYFGETHVHTNDPGSEISKVPIAEI
jgi:hypothetical protein